MAYALKYEAGYNSLQTTGKVSIYEDDWSGGSETLKLRANTLEVRYTLKGWEDPIIGLTAAFDIVNDKDDFFELLPLITAVEGQYWIKIERIEPSALILFQGFLQCKDNEQKYLQKQDIRLNASSYLSKLEYVDAPIIEDLENDTFINIIDNCLRQTGATDDIWINCSLYPVGSGISDTTTLFNKCGVYKEMFWKDNIKRDSALEILRKILSAFDCYLFWHPLGIWIIDRYADIWRAETIDYVEYTTGVEYWPQDDGSVIENTPDVYDFADPDIKKMNTRQIIRNLVGQKQVEININQQLMFNLIINNFENATYSEDDLPQTELRTWVLTDDVDIDWYDLGEPFRNIARAVNRQGWSEADIAEVNIWKGMFTSFRVSASPDIIMTITFKYATRELPFPTNEADEWEVWFRWTLGLNNKGNQYLAHDDDAGTWSVVVPADPPLNATNRHIVQGTEFDLINKSVQVTIQIPMEGYIINPEGPYAGDKVYTFGIGTEVKHHTGTPADNDPDDDCYFGDVKIITNLPPNDNYVKGEINTNVLNRKKIVQHLSDDSNLGIRNAIFYGSENTTDPDDLDEKTETWVDEHSPTTVGIPLAHMRIKDKFRLYNVNRQELSADLLSTLNYRPFQRFYDSNQAESSGGEGPHFIVTKTIYKPEQDMCSTTMIEYDVDEDINLI